MNMTVMIDHNHDSVLCIYGCYVRMMQPSTHEQLRFRVLLRNILRYLIGKTSKEKKNERHKTNIYMLIFFHLDID